MRLDLIRAFLASALLALGVLSASAATLTAPVPPARVTDLLVASSPMLPPVFAMPAASAPAAAPSVVNVTTPAPVVVPLTWGEWVQRDIFPWLWGLFSIGFAWSVRHLPGWAAFALKAYGEERFLRQCHDYAANMVAGATKDGTATYDLKVANALLGHAVEYGVKYGPAMVAWLGGKANLEARLISLLNLDPAASAADLAVNPPVL